MAVMEGLVVLTEQSETQYLTVVHMAAAAVLMTMIILGLAVMAHRVLYELFGAMVGLTHPQTQAMYKSC